MIMIQGISEFVVLSTIAVFITSQRNMYIVSLVSIITIILASAGMGVIVVLQRNHIRDTILMIMTFSFFCIFAWIVEENGTRNMLAKMAPSHCQSLAESLRAGIFKTSSVVASLTAPLLLSNLQYSSMAVVIIIVTHLVLFILRSKHFIDIKVID